MRYLFFDVESGGLDPEVHSLLSASFLVTGSSGSKSGSLDLLLRPDEGPIIATAEALAVNGIDLHEHELMSIRYGAGREFLESWLGDLDLFGDLVPVAHNATFDLSFLHKHLIPRGVWDELVTGQTIDTCPRWRCYHKRQGVKVGGGLQALADHYGMSGRYEAHTSGGDVLLMRDLFFHIEGLRSAAGARAAYP